MLRRCEHLVVMADSRKLRQRSSIIVAGIERISTLITDAGATDAEVEVFRSAGVKVLRLPVDPGDRLVEAS
jgi:DeoR family transcriptional regulator, ulaG and ulaABCDEF operon transcriptional repressor